MPQAAGSFVVDASLLAAWLLPDEVSASGEGAVEPPVRRGHAGA